ncbi:HalOD1 output domain-containing protein [Haloarcula laminariae]|uniref:HalOD1 output domain-containing protein n=1 Tax=Haloarcula laminariae TaxID=2961577 RepID=UPI0021C8ACB9|nr:HalOD1 output domain-containing protein [Halomicroarcula laminariae]
MTSGFNDKHVPESEALSHAVVVAVAEENGVDPLDLDERLYDCIDPDALDALFTGGGQDACGTVQFVMAGCHVEVTAERQLHVEQVHETPAAAEVRV